MILKKKRGSVTLLLAMSSTLVAIVSLGVYKLISASQNYQVVKTGFTKYQLLTSSLNTLVSNPDNCISVFKDQKYLFSLDENSVTIKADFFDVKEFVPEMTAEYFLIPGRIDETKKEEIQK